jgi:hypothetical protein
MGGITSMPGGRLTWIFCYKHYGGGGNFDTDRMKIKWPFFKGKCAINARTDSEYATMEGT